MKKTSGLVLLICILLIFVSACGGNKEETLSFFDDSDPSSASESETIPPNSQESSSKGQSDEDLSPESAGSVFDREIHVPASLVSDPTPMNLCMQSNWYTADRCFLMDGSEILYISGMQGGGKRCLHRIDKETAADVFVCGNTACEHNSEDCSARIGYGSILGYGIEDGVFWYCMDDGQHADEIRVLAVDTRTGKRLPQSFLIQIENIGDYETRNYSMDIQCIFLKGYIAVVQRAMNSRNGSFPGDPGIGSVSERCRIELFRLPEKEILRSSDTELLLNFAGEILDDQIDEVLSCRYAVLPDDEGSLYILKTSESPENPNEPSDTWKMLYGYTLMRWNLGSQTPEILLTSETEAAEEFRPYGNGVRLLLHHDKEESGLVSAAFRSEESEILAVFDRTKTRVRFAGEFAVGMEPGDLSINEKPKYCVFDLFGEKIAEIETVLSDPRFADPDKAPVIASRLEHADEDGLYLSWSGGIILLPFDGSSPVFFGYENTGAE